MVVEPGNVGVEAGVGGWRKPKTERVRTVAGIFVGRWVLIENGQYPRTGADSERVHRFDLRRPERIVARLNSGHPVDGAAETLGRVCTFVHKIARPQRCARHRAQRAGSLGVASPFIVGEEEEPVLHDRPSERYAEYVAQQLGRRVGFAAA